MVMNESVGVPFGTGSRLRPKPTMRRVVLALRVTILNAKARNQKRVIRVRSGAELAVSQEIAAQPGAGTNI